MNKNKFLIELSESDRTHFGEIDFEQQPLPQRVFSTIWALESEVNSGGFLSYFTYSGETVPFVVEALKTIGAKKAAGICKRAINTAFPNGLPAEAEEIQTATEELSEKVQESLGEIDQQFYEYPDKLTELLFDYVAKHPDMFGAIPTVS